MPPYWWTAGIGGLPSARRVVPRRTGASRERKPDGARPRGALDRGYPGPVRVPLAPWLALVALVAAGPGARGAPCPVQETRQDGALLERSAYVFPPWAEAPGFVAGETVGRYLPEDEYVRAAGDARFRLEKLRYASDGLSVRAYLYGPREEHGPRLPVVVYNRGSQVLGDVAPVHVALFRRLACAGYLVLAPMLRGSDGGEGTDEMGGADVHDVLNVLPLLGSLERADPRRLFLLGESRGGMMTFLALRAGFPARAAAVWGAFTDLGALVEGDAHMLELAHAVWDGFDERRAEIVAQRSALSWAEELETPLLLMHGGADTQIPVAQSEALAERLGELGRTSELVVFPGDGHLLLRNRAARDARVLDWFARFAGTRPPPSLKRYHGREIAETMHWKGAEWLLRATRQDEEDAELFLAALDVQPGWTVADVGCGAGYHTLRLARAVGPEGQVLAVDVQPEMLEMLQERARAAGIENVQSILGAPFDPWLPPDSCDRILLADVYHELDRPEPMLAALRAALKPDGRLVLLEFRAEDPKVPIKKLHKMSKAQACEELEANGFVLARSFDELPWQHLLEFARAEPAAAAEAR